MNDSIIQYYSKNTLREWGRLERHPLEFPITYRHITDIIGQRTLAIADIGGGPGRYSFELAKMKHQVTLVDLIPENIEFAKNKAKELDLTLKEFIVADATQLSMISNDQFDLTLMLGPLYHLLEHEARKQAIREALRITKKNCIVFLAFISRYAPVYDLLKRIPDENAMSAEKFRELFIKQNNRDVFGVNGFTHAYFIDPDEIEKLLAEFDIEIIKKFGAESIMAQSDYRLNEINKDEFNKWIDFAYELSGHQAGILGSEHIVYVIRKTG